MKKVIFLAGGLLLSLTGIAQTYSAPDSAGDNGTTNVYLGHQAGADTLNTGGQNVFVGYTAGFLNKTGYSNVFCGYQSGVKNTEGYDNVFVGSRSGKENTIGFANTFTGQVSGTNNTEGSENTFTGYGAGFNNTTGSGNVVHGTNTGYSNQEGSYNTFIGRLAGYNNNSAIGYNVFLGARAGLNNNGHHNVFLGYYAGKNETGSNKLYISNSDTSNPLVYGEFETKELKFNANKVGIGSNFDTFPNLTGLANSASYRLFVRGGILAEEVRIRLQSDWADYVFSDDYKLPTLKETEAFINENKHLPNMPSAKQVEEEGIEMGNIIKLQQEKIEELTLYLIQQEKEIQKLKEQNGQLEDLKAKVELLLNKD